MKNTSIKLGLFLSICIFMFNGCANDINNQNNPKDLVGSKEGIVNAVISNDLKFDEEIIIYDAYVNEVEDTSCEYPIFVSDGKPELVKKLNNIYYTRAINGNIALINKDGKKDIMVDECECEITNESGRFISFKFEYEFGGHKRITGTTVDLRKGEEIEAYLAIGYEKEVVERTVIEQIKNDVEIDIEFNECEYYENYIEVVNNLNYEDFSYYITEDGLYFILDAEIITDECVINQVYWDELDATEDELGFEETDYISAITIRNVNKIIETFIDYECCNISYPLELKDNAIPEEVVQYVLGGIVSRDINLGMYISDLSWGGCEAYMIEKEVVDEILENTFEYNTSDIVSNLQFDEGGVEDTYFVYYEIKEPNENSSYDIDASYNLVGYCKTGRNDYRIYIKRQTVNNDVRTYSYPQIIGIDVHYNANSKIAGFVFDNICDEVTMVDDYIKNLL